MAKKIMEQGKTNFWIALAIILGTVSLGSLARIFPVRAQIVPDGSLPTEVSSPDALNFTINGGATAGSNLFHSFREFSIPTNGQAFFNNATDIVNIFSRVTGGNISQIDGLLRANGTANLFLLNPAGIIFGPNAQLNIGGSFLGTTASRILFPDGISFDSNAANESPLLTINLPVGLQFGQNPGNIVNQASATNSDGNITGLEVQPGQSLALIGGEITIDGGGLNAPGGRIELGGLAGEGTIELTANNQEIRLSFPENISLANINLFNDARVAVRGQGGGEITVNANNLTATGGGRLTAGTEGAGDGGDIIVNANNINLSGVGNSEFYSGFYNEALPESSGTAGDTIIQTDDFSATSGAVVRAVTAGSGNAGNIKITSTNSLELLDGSIQSIAISGSTGSAGNITVTTGNYLSSGANGYLWSGTLESGRNAGNITVNADDLTLLNKSTIDSANRSGLGNAGNIEINAENDIHLSEESYLFAGSSGQGNAGNVILNAGGAISLVNSDIDANTLASSLGQSGDIDITARSLFLNQGSKLGASSMTEEGAAAGNVAIRTTDFVTLDNASDITVFSTNGLGGNIFIQTSRLNVRGGSTLFAIVQGNQSAGSLKVNASEAVEVSGFTENIPGVFSGSYLTISTLGDGNAGNLTINTGRLIVQNGAWISASTSPGRGTGGTIEINASESVALLGNTPDGLNASQITTDTGGEGAAGNIRITTGRLIIQNGSRVSALTLDSGSGGTLEINASELVEVSGQRSLGLFPSSIDTGSSGAGDAGNLSIQTPQLTLQNQGTIIVSSTGGGRAGNLTVDAPSMLLDNLASLRAQTTGGQGNIFLNSRDLVLSNNSKITTNATGEATGGNININTGVLAALENSDISANAQQAQGGRVIIDASGIFGTEFRDFSTPQSDITATSELGPQFSGTVEINTDIDVTSGLVQTPVLPDITGLVAGGCRDYQGSSFIVTGRGGKPPSPDEPLIPESLAVIGWVELPNLDLEAERGTGREIDFSQSELGKIEPRIVEATGYIIEPNGEVILTANQGNFSRFIPVFMPLVCPVGKE